MRDTVNLTFEDVVELVNASKKEGWMAGHEKGRLAALYNEHEIDKEAAEEAYEEWLKEEAAKDGMDKD